MSNCKSFSESFLIERLFSYLVMLFPKESKDSFEFLIDDNPVSVEDKRWFWFNELRLSKLFLSSKNCLFLNSYPLLLINWFVE